MVIRRGEDALDYFLGEGLLVSVSDEGAVHLSHRGIVEIEQSITRPDSSTEHFPVQVIQQHFHGAVGSVQNAPHSTANVTQNVGPNVGEIISLLQELRLKLQGLPPERKEEALQLVDGLEVEAKTEGRSIARLKALYAALMPFVTDVGAQVLATLIAKQLGL